MAGWGEKGKSEIIQTRERDHVEINFLSRARLRVRRARGIKGKARIGRESPKCALVCAVRHNSVVAHVE